MTEQEFNEWIKTNVTLLAAQRYSNKQDRIAYELGILTSILAALCYNDSNNSAYASMKFKNASRTPTHKFK
jgi:hypothetical protein